jgi:N-acetylglucosamine-6-phosphate deacetylase
MKSLLLKQAKVVLPEGELSDATVLVVDGKIAAINGNEDAEEAVDLSGHTLFPGFIDVHIHGAVNVDVLDADVSDLGNMARFLATRGITTWLPTFVPAADNNYASAIGKIALAMKQVDGPAARIAGIHYEGPFVNSSQCGALHTEYFKTYANPSDLDCLLTPSDASVKMITLAPEVDGGIALVRELRSRGWVVSIGHTRADVAVLDQAFAAGARHMTHFMNAMAPFHHRKPGPIAWGLEHDGVTFDMIADGVHLDPLILRLLTKTKGPKSISLISDAIAAAGRGDGDYQIWGETISVKDGRTSNASGNIAGSVITMLDAVRVMRSLGVSNVDLAQMASLNPARLLGLDNVSGSIAPGKRADLVALDASVDVALTIVGGEIAFQK